MSTFAACLGTLRQTQGVAQAASGQSASVGKAQLQRKPSQLLVSPSLLFLLRLLYLLSLPFQHIIQVRHWTAQNSSASISSAEPTVGGHAPYS